MKIAANVVVLAGLIITPGVANATPGTTQPGTTAWSGNELTENSQWRQGYAIGGDAATALANANATLTAQAWKNAAGYPKGPFQTNANVGTYPNPIVPSAATGVATRITAEGVTPEIWECTRIQTKVWNVVNGYA